MSQLVGKTLGPYLVLLKIRSTHTNVIYKAYDPRLGRNVALQVVLPDQPLPENLVAEMKAHAEAALAALDHPHIGRLLACECYAGQLCLVYDFVPSAVIRRRF
jgi:serine/threonine protein kinase